MDRLTKIALVSGIAILIAATALEAFGMVKYTGPVMSAGFYLLFFAFIQARRSRRGEVFGDERTWKVGSYSMAFSWVVTYTALVVTYVLIKNDFLLLSPGELIIVIMLVMGLTFMIGVIYFSRRRF